MYNAKGLSDTLRTVGGCSDEYFTWLLSACRETRYMPNAFSFMYTKIGADARQPIVLNFVDSPPKILWDHPYSHCKLSPGPPLAHPGSPLAHPGLP